MKKGDLISDKCANPTHSNGLGIILSECYSGSQDLKWYNIYYFKIKKVITEREDNFRLINEI